MHQCSKYENENMKYFQASISETGQKIGDFAGREPGLAGLPGKFKIFMSVFSLMPGVCSLGVDQGFGAIGT